MQNHTENCKMLSKIVKAGSITNLTDARFFSAFEVDFIGFCFDPQSLLYISPQNALAIKGWITGPKIVAEFANQDPDNIKNIIQFFEPDIIEIDEQNLETILPLCISLNKPLIVRTESEKETNEHILFYLAPLSAAEKIKDKSNFIFDLTESTTTAPDISNLPAIQLKGSPEQEVGIKSFDNIAHILESIEIAN